MSSFLPRKSINAFRYASERHSPLTTFYNFVGMTATAKEGLNLRGSIFMSSKSFYFKSRPPPRRASANSSIFQANSCGNTSS